MSAALPLLAAFDSSRVIAWRDGEPVSATQFLADAAGQAALLPARGPVLNLCADRYRFAVGLAAALMRGHTSLLPPNALPDTLARLRGAEPSLYGLTDDPALAVPGLALQPAAPCSGCHTGGAGALIAAERGASTIVSAPPLIESGQPAVCLLTSGSTGAPQPHRKTWGTLVLNIEAAAERLARLLERPTLAGLNLVATVPAQHSYGLESSVLLALLGGAAFDAGRPFYPADIACALERLPRPRALVTTPFHLKTLLAAGLRLPPADLVLCATAPLSPQLALAAERAFGGPLVEIYGCTEAGQIATRRTVQSDVWQTFGALRVAREDAQAVGSFQADRRGVEAADRGMAGKPPEFEPADESAGRFVVSGGQVHEATALADVLQIAPPLDGRHFRLLGRAGDVIHVAGKRSSLAHLNYHLNSIEGVLDGAFWLPPDVADAVVRPLAFVVAPGLEATRITAELRTRLDPVFVPRRVVKVEALPREATGKLGAQALERFARTHSSGQGEPDSDAAVSDAAFHGSVAVLCEIAADHPAFAGHFPGRPLLPGVVLLAEVWEAVLAVPALAARLGPRPTLGAAKFLAPVPPGASLEITLIGEARGLRFEVRRGEVLAASGQWQAAGSTGAPVSRERGGAGREADPACAGSVVRSGLGPASPSPPRSGDRSERTGAAADGRADAGEQTGGGRA